ncbi:Transport permease protein [Planctomycetales bacterium 10988]|nr:Transport permease protein [Planctomycetales bacterium 10988]
MKTLIDPAKEASLTLTKPSPPSGLMNHFLVIWALTWREMIRFFRQKNRVIGAFGQPLLFWVLFGAGLGPSFQLPAETVVSESSSYQEYFLPGTVMLILLFTAIFSTISIIEDRKEGIMQSVLVAPISRMAMVAGKLLGGTLLALTQGILFLILGCWALGISVGVFNWAATIGLLFIVAFGLCGLGYCIAWRMDSTQGFHAIMSLVLLPMWLLSGAFFPATEGWISWVIRLNPFTYAVAAFRRTFYWGIADAPFPLGLPSLTLSWVITLLFTGLLFWACCFMSAQRTAGDYQ